MGYGWESERVHVSTLAVGSLDALRAMVSSATLVVAPSADVVVVPTAAAFTGAAEAALVLARALEGLDARVEALMVTDRAASDEPYFVSRLADADLVVLGDGSALHARSVWRHSRVGEAINAATRLVAVGSVASVLGEVMIDPRGGAPTTGLNYRAGVALCAPASLEQLGRTRLLLGDDVTLVVLGSSGVLEWREGTWRVVCARDVEVTRGARVITL